jgi:hypothetical protein
MTQEIDQSDSQARSPEATTLAETSSSPVSGSVNVTPKPDPFSPQGPVPTGPSDCRQAVRACALSKFRKWFKAGFGSELLPIIPPDAQLREGSTVSEHMRGKVPGVRNSDGTWSGLGGKWSAPDWKPSVADLKRWEQDGASLGVQSRRLPQIDSDVEDEQITEDVETLVVKYFGLSPVRLHEGSPRRLYMFRCDGLRTTRLAWHDRNRIKHAVEALCQGQQGVHDSPYAKGGRYTYRFNESPVDWGFDNLTEITPAAVEGFFGELAAYVEASGGTIERGAGAAYTASIGARLSLDDISLHAPSPELVIEALKGWPNDGDSLPSHDDFVRAMAAIKAALGPAREDYYPDVEQWALKYPDNDDDYVRKVWDSITDASLGADWLLKTAGASGAAAQADFADDVEEVNAAIGNTGRDRMLKRYVWVEGLGRYYDIQRGSFLDARKFNAANVNVKPFGLSGMKTAEAIFQNHPNARKVAIVTFRPGDQVITTEENEHGLRVEAVNLWRPSSLKPRFDADIAPYDDLLTRLFGEPGAAEREHFLNWWAYLLQNPGKKIGHALLLVGSQGVGKDTILSPLFAAVGRHNVATIDTNTLSNQWTFYLKRQIIYAQEIITHGRRDLYNHIKT